MIFRSRCQEAELVGVDEEGDGAEMAVLVFSQRTDDDGGVLLLVGSVVIQPLVHEVAGGFQPFFGKEEVNELVSAPGFDAAKPVSGAPTTEGFFGDEHALTFLPGGIGGEDAVLWAGKGRERSRVRDIVEADKGRGDAGDAQKLGWVGGAIHGAYQ